MRPLFSFSSVAIAATVWLALACKPTLDAPSPSAGSVDFSTYIAVGNSLTAGYSNGTSTGGGLYYDGQINSYPSILAKAMQATGSGPVSFLQPLFAQGSAGSGYARLDGLVNGQPIIKEVGPDPAIIETVTPAVSFKDIDNGYAIHNLGVPGIRVSDITIAGYGTVVGNPYFERILPDVDQFSTYLQYVSKRRPTFFTNWLGNNDILGYATAGAASSSITDQGEFETKYTLMLDSLMRTAKKGLVATIPDVTSAPYFNTVPAYCIPITRQSLADSLNYGYKDYNAGVKLVNQSLPAGSKLDSVHFAPGANVPIIADSDPLLAPLAVCAP